MLYSSIPLAAAVVSALASQASATLDLPYCTYGRDIVSYHGKKVVYAGANWPGHLEAMIPEGLQYASISDIVSKIKGFGLNSIRLTYATEMVDDIYSLGHDTTLAATLSNALGAQNGSAILAKILHNNPTLKANSTRLDVFDAVAKGLAAQDIILHLDNQVSRAGWCCLPGDGNGWWGEQYFSTANWTRGWSYMAGHGAKKWPSFASVGLRNEVRFPLFHDTTADPYDWYTWYERMTEGAQAVHGANKDVLIFFGGLESDTTDAPIPLNQTLNGTVLGRDSLLSTHFTPSNFSFADKIVLEIHKYDDFFNPTTEPCSTWLAQEYPLGFQALNASDPSTKYHVPLVMTEWGYAQDGVAYQHQYQKCMIELVKMEKFGWMQWGLQGSYYIRQGTQDSDESWGLLNHSWNGTRSPVSAEIVYLPVNKLGLPICGDGPELPSILELPLRIVKVFTEIFNQPKYKGWAVFAAGPYHDTSEEGKFYAVVLEQTASPQAHEAQAEGVMKSPTGMAQS